MYVNFFAVIVAAIAGMAVGAAWYSPALFGKKWTHLAHYGAGEQTHGAFSRQAAMATEFVSLLLMSFVLANLAVALGVHGPLAAMRLAFWVWLGFQATLLFSGVLFERRPVQLFYINAGERFAALLIMSLIVGLW